MRATLLGVVLLAVACGGSNKTPAPTPPVAAAPAPDPTPPPPAADTAPTGPDAEFGAAMAQIVVMFDTMAAEIDAVGPDCGKIADAMIAVMDDNAAMFVSLKTWQDNPVMDQKVQDWVDSHVDRLTPSMTTVGAAGMRCTSDPRFAEVTRRIEAMR